MSVGVSNCCGSLPPRDVLAGGQQSPQQAPVDQVDAGGPAPTDCGAPVQEPAPAQTPVPAQADTSFEAGGPDEGGCMPAYVEPAPVQAAQPPAEGDTVTETATPAPAATTAPDAVDPNTGQPLNPSTTTSTPPEPIAVPEAATTAPVSTTVAPAPVAEGPTPAPAVTPTDPYGPGSKTNPYGPQNPTGAVGPATALATWPQWHQSFLELGVDAENIARIGSQSMSDAQLALVYMTIRREMDAARQSGNVGTDKNGVKPGGGWSQEWEQKFTALGLAPEQVAQIRELAKQNGADDAAIMELYNKVVAMVANEPAESAVTWTPEVEQAFTDLGMPKEYLEAYKAQLAAAPQGIVPAYKHAKERIDAFKATGYYDKLAAEGMPEVEIWSTYVLGDAEAKPEDLKKAVETLHGAKAPMWQKMLQHGITFFPGGELLQYGIGKKLVTGESIDRTSPMNILFAGLSGLAAVMAFRGAMSIGKGWGAIKSGLPELTKAGGATAGIAADDAVLGALKTGGLKQKFLSFLPGTSQHAQVVGFGRLENAAKAFNNGGATALMQNGKDGAMQVATLNQMFDDLKTVSSFATKGGGTVQVANLSMNGGKIAYLGNLGLPFKSAQTGSMTLADASHIIVNKGLGTNGKESLAAMLEVGGQKLALDPTWLKTQVAFVDDLGSIGSKQLAGIGQIMAADATKALQLTPSSNPLLAILGKIKPGASQYYDKLAKTLVEPAWYQNLTRVTAGEAALAATAIGGTGAAAVAATLGKQAATTAGAVAHGATGAATGTAQAASGAAMRSDYVTESGIQVIRRNVRAMPEVSKVPIPPLAGQRYRELMSGMPVSSYGPSETINVDTVIGASRYLEEVKAAAAGVV